MVVYREHAVPCALRAVVARGWTLEAAPPGVHGWPVLPDGHVDLVATAGHRVMLAGPATRTHLADVPARGGVAGVRLRPGATHALFGLPAAALRDQAPDLADVWPAARRSWDDDALGGLVDPLDRLRGLYALLGPRAAAAPDRLVEHAVALIVAGDPSVTSVAHTVGLTPRQLLRRFDLAIGYGPKRLQRIVRLQRLLAVRRRHPQVSLASTAADAGYADQAHLTREIVSLTTLTPTALLTSRTVDIAN